MLMAGRIEPSRGKRRAAMLAAGVALLAMLPVIVNGFTSWDDPSTISENWRITPPSWEGLWAHWAQPHMSLYVPVTYTAWAIVSAISHAATSTADPGYFHQASLLLNALAAVVVCLWVRQMLVARAGDEATRTPMLLGSLVGAAVFGAHPVQVESVAWASGLKDVLFGLLSVTALWRLAIAQANWGDLARRRRELVIAGGLLLLAMLSKPTAVVLPVMAAAMLAMMGGPWRRALSVMGVGLLMVLPWAIVAKLSQPAYLAVDGGPLWARPLIALDAYAFYLFKLVWPAHLAVDYGRSPSAVLESGTLWWSWVVPVLLAAGLWLIRRRYPLVVGGMLLAALPIGPVSGLVTFEFQQYSTVADHYLYLPMAGVGLAIGAVVSAVVANRRRRLAVVAVAAALIVVCVVQDWRQMRHWRDTRSLFEHTSRVNPRSVAAISSLGSLALNEHRIDDALRLTEQALAIKPAHLNALVTRGGALHQAGRSAEAEEMYRAALAASPNDPLALASLGGLLAESGRTDEAERALERAVQVDPDLAAAHLNYGTLLAATGRMQQAAPYLRRAVRLKETDPRALTNLAIVLLNDGRRQEAMTLLERALEVDPDFGPARSVMERNR